MASLSTFAAAAELTDSPFWKQTFQEASKGKFPLYYSFRDGTLTYMIKKKQTRLVCPEAPEALLPAVIQFFRTTSGYEPRSERAPSGAPEAPQTQWTKIKDPSQRKQLLDDYVHRWVERDHLPESAYAQGVNALQVGLVLQAFPSVLLSETGDVEAVEGFYWDADQSKFCFKKPSLKARKGVETTVASDEDNTDYRRWMKPWIRILRMLTHFTDLGSAIPSATEP
jgi:hypothetical protein